MFVDVFEKTDMNLNGRVLITGGTSGLGLELVLVFLRKGFTVITTGRRMIEMPDFRGKFKLYQVDFADLGSTADVFAKICKVYDFDYVIYNAGILSPPVFTRTNDGFEYTFQVNFLAHLLANEIIIRHHLAGRPLRIAAVTSMAYRMAESGFKHFEEASGYRAWKAYSDSKLCLALMCRYYSAKLAESRIQFCSFDPGIFSSELYRTQSGIFRMIYQAGVRILRKPTSPARVLAEILMDPDIKSGAVYDVRKRICKLREPEADVSEAFWHAVLSKTSEFIR